jgi:superfamily II DNA or RNA helicase
MTPYSNLRPPRHWQTKALAAVRKTLRENDRCRVYAVPGAGKTDLFIRLSADYDTVVVVVPRLTLAWQTFQNFQRYADFGETCFVCGDPRGTEDEIADDTVNDIRQLRIMNTTRSADIAGFLSLPGRKLIITSYHSSKLLVHFPIDLVIFDEAHHAAEYRLIGKAPKRAEPLVNTPNVRKRLFVTATEKVYSADLVTIADQQGHYAASLADEEQFGPLAYNYAYSKALDDTDSGRDKIVKRFVVHWAHVNDPGLQRVITESKQVRNTATWQREQTTHMLTVAAIKKVMTEHKLTHGAIFANTIKNADHVRDLYRTVTPKTWCETISSREGTTVSLGRLSAFKSAKRGLFTNVNSLGEGMDVPCIDLVRIADPMQSVRAIAQKICRGIRYDHDKPDDQQELHVVVPCYIDQETGHPTLESYAMIAEVIGSLGEVDNTFRQEIMDITQEAKASGPGEPRFLVPKNCPNIDPALLAKTVATMVYSPVSINWHQRYAELKAHLQDSGGKYPLVKQPPLYQWVSTQRQNYRGKKGRPLTQEQITLLEALPGWTWDRFDDKWHQRYTELKQYLADNDGKYPSGRIALSTWVIVQRAVHNGTNLAASKHTTEQIALLEALPGWQWQVRQSPDTRWEELFAWCAEHDRRPNHYGTPEERSLHGFFKNQRTKYDDPRCAEIMKRYHRYPERRAQS